MTNEKRLGKFVWFYIFIVSTVLLFAHLYVSEINIVVDENSPIFQSLKITFGLSSQPVLEPFIQYVKAINGANKWINRIAAFGYFLSTGGLLVTFWQANYRKSKRWKLSWVIGGSSVLIFIFLTLILIFPTPTYCIGCVELNSTNNSAGPLVLATTNESNTVGVILDPGREKDNFPLDDCGIDYIAVEPATTSMAKKWVSEKEANLKLYEKEHNCTVYPR